MMKKILSILFPKGSLQRKVLAKILRRIGILQEKAAVEYYDYFTSLSKAQIPLYPTAVNEDVTFSIVVPVFNTPEKYIRPLIDSITTQTYRNWELVLADASDDAGVSALIADLTAHDDRIKVIKIKNLGISANTNEAIKVASGKYVIFSDHDDTLDVEALSEIYRAVKKYPAAGLLYSDEDKLSEDGSRYFGPHFKPDWSPDLATSVNYITHLTTVKKSLLESVGMLDPKKDGAQDYDLMLRIADSGAQIVHIPRILYHWREAERSTARAISNKPHALQAGVASLKDHLERQGQKDAVILERADRPGFYEVEYKSAPKVSVIIPRFATNRVMTAYVDRLLTRTHTGGMAVEFVVPEGVHPTVPKDSPIKLRMANEGTFAVTALEGAHDVTIWINKLALPEHGTWVKKLSGLAGIERIAAAAPVIIDDTDCVYDAGLVYEGNRLIPLFLGTPFTDNPTFFGNTEWCRDVDALSGNITVLRKSAALACVKLMKDGDFSDAVQRYTLEQGYKGHDNCLWTNVVFNDLTVTGFPVNDRGESQRRRFNPALVSYGNMFHIRADQEVQLNRLMRLPVEDKTYE